MRPFRFALLSLSWLALAVAAPASAEQFQSFDSYEVHYNTFNSSFLTPEVARAYDIQRSQHLALLNIAVLDNQSEGKKPVKAMISGSMKNLLGQTRNLDFSEIREGDAVYYISSFRFTDDERWSFAINVQPDPNQPAYQLKFDKQFYVD